MSYTVSADQATRVLILSKDQDSISALRENNLNNQNVEIHTFSNTNRMFLFAEECQFDVIIFDYSISGRNTLHFLEYLSKANNHSRISSKIVFIESSNQIKESVRTDLLKFANEVISKSSIDFRVRCLTQEKFGDYQNAISC